MSAVVLVLVLHSKVVLKDIVRDFFLFSLSEKSLVLRLRT